MVLESCSFVDGSCPRLTSCFSLWLRVSSLNLHIRPGLQRAPCSADDIPSVSPMHAGVEDLLLIGVGEDDDDESRSGPGDPLLGSGLSADWLAVLFVIDVSGELTPESVDV